MTDSPSAYPLQWPAGRKRTPPHARKVGKFSRTERQYRDDHSWNTRKDLTIADAIHRVQAELDRIGARLPVISTNVELRLDGLPRSDRGKPADPGVALYFQLAGKPTCLPCDTYTTVADNMAGIAAHIEATRAVERHGVATVSEMFAGFQALPPPTLRRPWREVLGMHRKASALLSDAERVYRELARQFHPDAPGGSHAMMAELNVAIEDARAEFGETA